MDVCLLWVLCVVVRQRSLRRAGYSSRGSYRLWCVVVCDLETSWMRNQTQSVWLSLKRRCITGCISYMPLIVTVKHNCWIFRCIIPVVFYLQLNRGSFESKHNYHMLLSLFKPTTCFGPFTGQSSGHKIYIIEELRDWERRRNWSTRNAPYIPRELNLLAV